MHHSLPASAAANFMIVEPQHSKKIELLVAAAATANTAAKVIMPDAHTTTSAVLFRSKAYVLLADMLV